MRVAAISDLHVVPDEGDDLLLRKIRERVAEISPDVFVVAGDLSDTLSVLSRTLNLICVESCENLFVPGNHDVWFEDGGGPSSLDKYSRIIAEECKSAGFHYLPDAPHVIDNLAFIGSIGWYDYSFRREDMDIPLESYEQKEHKGAVWYDLFRIDWSMTDTDATELFNNRIRYDLETLPNDVERVVYVSHHLPFQGLTIYKDRFPWDFHSAFMGAESTGQLLLEDERVFLTISGHSHVRNMIQEGRIAAMTVPLGYGRPDDGKLEEFVRDAIAVIDIEGTTVSAPNFVKGDICVGLPYVSSRH